MTIRKSIRVARTPEIAFKVFCEEMAAWWPGGFGGAEARPTMEQRVGGRFFEKNPDGTEFDIGRITAYQPPEVVAFTWRAPTWEAVTQVEVRFIAEGSGTRVELEHSGWEQDGQTREARKSYDGGWDFVLGHYLKHFAAEV
jgi:uncharacterized protein YndB with AHSA1/START domain